MSFFNPSLLLSSYEATNQSFSYRARKSSCASLDSWIFDAEVDHELNSCKSCGSEDFSKPDSLFCHMSISLEDRWLQFGREDAYDDGKICSSFPVVNEHEILKKSGKNKYLQGDCPEAVPSDNAKHTFVLSGNPLAISRDTDGYIQEKRIAGRLSCVKDSCGENFTSRPNYPHKKDDSKSFFFNHLFSNQRTKNDKSSSSSFCSSNQNETIESARRQNITESPHKLELSTNRFLPTNRQKSLLNNQQQLESSSDQVQVKTKIRTLWNSMKYGWRMKREVNLKIDTPIWLLGQYYHSKLLDVSYDSSDSKANTEKLKCVEAKEHFKQDLLSRIWLTYRLNFPAIPGTDYISDSGWGCMLRAGQMMMAQALLCHFLSRAWRLSSVQTQTTNNLHRMIIRWFGDTLSSECPFSIHHLVYLGEKYGRKVGDWYGPTHAANVLRNALLHAQKNISLLDNVCMYVAPDGIVFKQDVIDLCTGVTRKEPNQIAPTLVTNLLKKNNTKIISPHELKQNLELEKIAAHANRENSSNVRENVQSDLSLNHRDASSVDFRNGTSDFSILSRHVSECNEAYESVTSYLEPCPDYEECMADPVSHKWRSLILFVSVRLGNEKLNPYYIPCLKSLLAYENCTGIIGGRPKHAVYFVGWQDEKLIHMDPHRCQPAVDVEKEDFNAKSFHCSAVRTMSFTEMDPSCTIGFYFRTKEDFDVFADKISEIVSPLKNMDYPVFTLVEGRRTDMEEHSSHCTTPGFHLNSSSSFHNNDDDDDYILL